MEPGIIVLLILMTAVGVIAGMYIERFRKQRKETHGIIHGIIHADCSDPQNGPGLFLEPQVPIADIVSKKQVVFDVHVIQHISHK